MGIFISGLVIFFGLHLYTAFRSRLPERDMAQRIGPSIYRSIYSLGSLVGLIMLIYGYGLSRGTAPIESLPQAHILALILMWVAFVLLAASYLPMGHIKRAVRDPMVIGVGLWGLAHLLTGIDMAGLLLFGSFLIFSVIDLIALKRRGEMDVSDVTISKRGDIFAVIIGTALHLALILGLHSLAFGVPALA